MADKEYHLQYKYKMSLEEYEKMLADQGGVCAICKKGCGTGRMLAVDHDHRCCPGRGYYRTCGKCVRGLVCIGCNSFIGRMEANQGYLEGVLSYLNITHPSGKR